MTNKGEYMKQIDLHMHTNKSDGALTPKQIIDEAVKANLQAISITDHDTIDAYNDETIKYAKEQKYFDAESRAKNKKIGIWSMNNLTPAWEFRKSHQE